MNVFGSTKIGFIGAGNMGSCLLGGLLKNDYPANQLYVSDVQLQTLEPMRSDWGVHVTTDNAEVASHVDILIFAIKPQLFKSVAAQLREVVSARLPCIVSIMAGIRMQCLEKRLAHPGAALPIVRAMPNTPALLGAGASALCANSYVSKHNRNQAESILRAVGVTAWLQQESGLDIVTALSGSGPAYFFYMLEMMQKAAVQLGLDADIARLLTLQTALGAAKMAIETERPVAELRQQVTSPHGTTEAAIAVLQDLNMERMFLEAIRAATVRAQALAAMAEQDE